MAYLGLVPSEHSSGGNTSQGGITKTGNGHVRRVLVEAAWNYRFPARKTRRYRSNAPSAPPRRYRPSRGKRRSACAGATELLQDGKEKNRVTTAVARELAGFIWAIACEVQGKAHGSKALA